MAGEKATRSELTKAMAVEKEMDGFVVAFDVKRIGLLKMMGLLIGFLDGFVASDHRRWVCG